MSLIKSLLGGLACIVGLILFIQFILMPSTGFAGLAYAGLIILAVVPVIIIGSLIVGILSQTNHLQPGAFSKSSSKNIAIGIALGFVCLIILLRILDYFFGYHPR